MRKAPYLSRRDFIGSVAAAGTTAVLPPFQAHAQSGQIVTKAIPSSGEAIPVIGLGSWITFNVGNDREARENCVAVMRDFFAAGGKLIDSSPMYGSSQNVIGEGLQKLGKQAAVFSAEKVWTSSGGRGPAQIEQSRQFWRVPHFDLMQVHNLLSWEDHLKTLQAMKAEGKLRYVGITTSEGRRHREFERIMQSQTLDFIQVTYNVVDREVEERILPLARERGIAVLINRPFQEGILIRKIERHKLPPWAGEIGCANWAQFILKFIVSHPAVTCAIPATSQVAHLRENMGAAYGPMPDEPTRRRMADYVAEL